MPRGNKGNCPHAQKNLEYSFCRALVFFIFRISRTCPIPFSDSASPRFLPLSKPQILSSLFPRANRQSGAIPIYILPTLARKRGVGFLFGFLFSPLALAPASHTSLDTSYCLSASSIGDRGRLVTEALAFPLQFFYIESLPCLS